LKTILKIALGLVIGTSAYAEDKPVTNKPGIYGLTREETIQQRNWDKTKNNPYNSAIRENMRNESFKWTGDPQYFENNGTFDIKPHIKENTN
jgi:hypothetical protein